MMDTDWRPSPCPVCNETRHAAKDPMCENPSCKAYLVNKEDLHLVMSGLDKEIPTADSLITRVESYQTPDGKIHESKKAAVASLVEKTVDQYTGEDGHVSTRVLSLVLVKNAQFRVEIMKLLKELS